MVKNTISFDYKVIREAIRKFTPPIDLPGIGNINIEDVSFELISDQLHIRLQTIGAIKSDIKVIGNVKLSNDKEKIYFDIDNIKFDKLPLALKLASSLLKSKIIDLVEKKAQIKADQILALINGNLNPMLADFEESKGIATDLNITKLDFDFVMMQELDIVIGSQLDLAPNIKISSLPSV